MTISNVLLQLPAMLQQYGVDVIEFSGWKTRDVEKGTFTPFCILDHHDGMGLHNYNVPNNMVRPGQYGSQIWIGWNGTVCMLAAGRMPHAGIGGGYGALKSDKGNSTSIGVETDYAGSGEWPQPLLRSQRIVHFCLAKLMEWRWTDA